MRKNSICRYLLCAMMLSVFSQCSKEEESFTVQDIDGNVYSTVKINDQIWMAENLKTTRLNDGTQLVNIVNPTTWIELSETGYCWYNNDEAANKNQYGALYNFRAVNTGRLCPSGWHVPNDAELSSMIDFLGGERISADKLKITGIPVWSNNATNESGFSAKPAGNRGIDFINLSYMAVWWSSSSTEDLNHCMQLHYSCEVVTYISWSGFSVRCIKD